MAQDLAEFGLIVFANDLIDALERYAFDRIGNDEFLGIIGPQGLFFVDDIAQDEVEKERIALRHACTD